MKVIIKKEESKTIEFSDKIFQDGILVGTYGGNAVIITRGEFIDKNTLKALCIDQNCVKGNNYDVNRQDIRSKIQSGEEFQWFQNNQWKDALKWLIDSDD